MEANSPSHYPVPVLGFVGYSGAGKTTLLVALLTLFRSHNIRAAVIKNTHHDFEIDKPAKDSYRLRQAGATQTILASKKRLALVIENDSIPATDPTLADVLARLDHHTLDIVLVEGFKHEHYKKIEVHRLETKKELLFHNDKDIIALVSDHKDHSTYSIPSLDINNPTEVYQHIMTTFFTRSLSDTGIQNTAKHDDCCTSGHNPGLLPIEEARTRVQQKLTPVSAHEKLAIRESLNRVLSRDIKSDINVPGHTNSAMDGYAVRGDDLQETGSVELKVVATVMAGKPIDTTINVKECARIMTGGKLPGGTDTVIMQEHVQRIDDTIHIEPHHQRGQNVRQAGEDIAIGQTIITTGKQLTAADLGLLASLGIAEIHVYRRIRVAFFSTGDELQSVGQPLAEGQIYDSNRYTLYGMLTRFGAEIIDMGNIVDEETQIESAFQLAASQADVLITSGGVSVGDADYVKSTLEKLGKVDFWKIAIKPGKPLAFGKIDNCWFFGLPGNPVSAMVTFYQIVLPALQRLAGHTVDTPPLTMELPCRSTIRKRPGRIEYQRGIILTDSSGELVVESTGSQSSGVLSSMSAANCFIVLPLENAGVEPGSMVTVQPFGGLI